MSQTYDRIFNFSAGPSVLPVEVLEESRDQMLNYKGTGMSVMEMSHRSKAFEAIIGEAEQDVRTLLAIPENYKVLFLQGGASLQFSMIPLSFLQGGSADFAITGSWGNKALDGAAMVGGTRKVFDAKETNYDRVCDLSALNLDPEARFLHVTSNETIQGVQFQHLPSVSLPVVCDMSSDILSRPIDVSKFALIYAGAQKNMGPAGVALVVIREDFLEKAPEKTHPMLDYRLQVANTSLYNTPPCWSIYICGLVYKHLLKNGGLKAAAERNQRKAKLLYDAIDASGGFYKGHSQKDCRSTMNVTFTLPSDEKTAEFLAEAKAHKLDGLKGHRSVGGMRASIYNAFPEDGCQVLADVMRAFADKG